MERAEYERLNAVEDTMWWFRGLHAHLLAALARHRAAEAAAGRVLDAGCGTGGLLARLRRSFPETAAIGLDLDPDACAAARAKAGCAVCVGSADALPFADASLAAILSADLLCHRAVAEGRALGEFRRCLAPGGILILNLPAYQWLLSAHDRAVHNVRRYTRRRLARLLAEADFAPIEMSYWNTLLFPLMAIRRTFARSRIARSDVMLYPAPVEAAFHALVRFETMLLNSGVTLPFGGSLLAIAVKA
ncbi:MAG TPA: class I SAM-dependent methyltransferase [Stellaceae bacterium]|nr:class I SAM-dependent methyltransferase [Stellaceae bacterium]